MQADLHHTMRRIIDQCLVGEASPEQQQALREHLRACAQCESYAEDGRRAIAGLSDFSFAADPASQSKIHAALAIRAQQLQAAQQAPGHWGAASRRARIVLVTAAALLLTLAGSFGAVHIGDWFAVALHLPLAQAQTGLLTFWIAPSWCFALLLPLLLLVSAKSADRKGQIV